MYQSNGPSMAASIRAISRALAGAGPMLPGSRPWTGSLPSGHLAWFKAGGAAPFRWGPTMPMLVRNLQDRLLELRQLRDKALARRDATQAEALRAEIEELTAYLEEIFEGAADA